MPASQHAPRTAAAPTLTRTPPRPAPTHAAPTHTRAPDADDPRERPPGAARPRTPVPVAPAALALVSRSPGSMDPRLAPLMRAALQAPALSSPHDPAERQADALAGHPVTTPRRLATPPRGDGDGLAPPGFADMLARARGAGRPLPPAARRRAESQIHGEFAGVRVHDDDRAHDLAARIDARAFTSGRDIFFGRGAHAPHTPRGQQLLTHELAHVAQRPTADGPIHRVIVVAGKRYEGWRVRGSKSSNVQAAWTGVKTSAHHPANGWTDDHLSRLILWVTRDSRYSAQVWMTARHYSFTDWNEAAEALDAETRAQANRRREKELARTAKAQHPEIATRLATSLNSVAAWIDQNYPGRITVAVDDDVTVDYPSVWAYLEQFQGQYAHWYPRGSVQQRMTAPVEKKVSTNFAILREVLYALINVTAVGVTADAPGHAPQEIYSEGEPRYGSGPDPDEPVRIDKGEHETRKRDFTPKPDHPWVEHARARGMPLRAGASNTTDRLLLMAEKAGVGAPGKQAIAWAGFIFWNTRFYTASSPAHTFHEIMDIANRNHGVPYNIDNPYQFTAAAEQQPQQQPPQAEPQPQQQPEPPPAPQLEQAQPQQQVEPQQQQQQQQQVEPQPQPQIRPPMLLKGVNFRAGKTLHAAKQVEGELDLEVRFVAEPGPDLTDLPLVMHKVLCTEDLRIRGLARLEPMGYHPARSVYVRIADLYGPDGAPITD